MRGLNIKRKINHHERLLSVFSISMRILSDVGNRVMKGDLIIMNSNRVNLERDGGTVVFHRHA